MVFIGKSSRLNSGEWIIIIYPEYVCIYICIHKKETCGLKGFVVRCLLLRYGSGYKMIETCHLAASSCKTTWVASSVRNTGGSMMIDCPKQFVVMVSTPLLPTALEKQRKPNSFPMYSLQFREGNEHTYYFCKCMVLFRTVESIVPYPMRASRIVELFFFWV